MSFYFIFYVCNVTLRYMSFVLRPIIIHPEMNTDDAILVGRKYE